MRVKDTSRVCVLCRFWNYRQTERAYLVAPNGAARRVRATCKRHAPMRDEHDADRPKWPTTSAIDWCGDFERISSKVQIEPQPMIFRRRKDDV